MAFLSKIGSVIKQTASRGSSLEISASRPFIYQVMRCMSSKLFIGGTFDIFRTCSFDAIFVISSPMPTFLRLYCRDLLWH